MDKLAAVKATIAVIGGLGAFAGVLTYPIAALALLILGMIVLLWRMAYEDFKG